MKKLLSTMLSVALLLSVLPGQVLAAGRGHGSEAELPAEVLGTLTEEDSVTTVELPAQPMEAPAELPAQLAEEERTVVGSGSCGTNVTWTFYSDGELYISGTGAMNSSGSWTGYRDQITSVVIDSGVTSIRYDAFYNCSALTSVVIPESVTSIGSDAFSGCSNLAIVFYIGTYSQWYDISISYSNSALTNAKRYYISSLNDISHLSILPCENGSATLSELLCPVGTSITVFPKPTTGYRLGTVYVDDVAIEGNTFVASGDHVVSVTFEPAQAQVVASGDCGDNVTWVFYDNGELYISGTGAMWDYSTSDHAPWYADYRDQITSVVIDDGVTAIGGCAFYECAQLTTVTIPNSVKAGGTGAFAGCPSLTTAGPTGGGYHIEFAWTDTIPSSAFSSCTSLTTVNIPESVTSIGSSAFSSCASLASIVIPEGVTSIGSSAFYNCFALTSVNIPEGVTEIERSAFHDCSSLTSIVIPEGVTSIGSSAFHDCSSLTSIVIPEGVTSIGSSAFYGCSSLTTINIPDSVTRIDYDAFDTCRQLKRVVLHKNVEIYSNGSFAYCPALQDVLFLGTEADRRAMNINDSSLKSAQWHYLSSRDEILTVTAQATDHGTVVTSETLCLAGEQITVAGRPDAGYRLRAVLVDGRPIAGNTFVASASHVVTGDFELYKTARMVASGACGANVFWYLYEDGELYLTGTGAMENYSNYNSSYAPWYANYRDQITSVVIDSGVTSIGHYAFSGCSSLTSVSIPEGITSIGGAAFYDCSSLTSVVIPEGVTSIGGSAFSGCSALTSIVIPEGVTSIENGAFQNCSSLTSIAIPEGVTSIGGSAFSGCSALTSIVIPEGVTSIENGAFRNCSVLASVTLPHSLTSIKGDYYSSGGAFSYCSALTSVTIPENVNSIGYGAFYGCSALTTVEFLGDAPTTVGSDAFPSKTPGTFLIQYHQGKTGWTTPKWEGYYTECVDAVKDYSALNAENRNTQNILFVLNEDSNTATVGDNSTDDNNAGYNGSSGGVATIPDIVTKNGKSYRVIGINQQAFSKNQMLKTVALGKNISSVEGSAFQRCPSFTAFTVPADSTRYSARSGILFDKMGAYLYVYPSGKSGEKYTVPASVTTIGNLAFSGNLKLSSITVGSTVTAIGAGAFSGCNSLEEITLPFIGASLTNNNGFKSVFNNNWNGVPESLKTVTITGGKLANDDRTWNGGFSGCEHIERLILPANDTFIPRDCFENCHALKSIVFTDTAAASQGLPEGHVIIPKRITKIGEDAFYGCTSLKQFIVDGQNPAYCSDQWGVLYTKDQSTLIAYPSARKWPYYNVSDRTTSISRYAFYQCSNLVNLYIPRTVKTLESQCIYSCPGLTVCVYQGSPADVYTGNNSLTAWYMDNYVLQGLEIYSLPDQQAFRQGSEDFSGFYLAANGGKALQADGYTLSYDPNRTGLQTVTVSYQGLRAGFPILLYGATDQLLDFGGLDLPDGATAYAAVYRTDGKMTRLAEVTVLGGKAQLAVSRDVYATMGEAKLFVLQNGSFVPLQAEVTISR